MSSPAPGSLFTSDTPARQQGKSRLIYIITEGTAWYILKGWIIGAQG